MGLFGDLLRAAGSAAFEAIDSALTAQYNAHWEEEEDKAVFFKLMEKWNDFFSNLEISDSINFIDTGKKVFCASTGHITSREMPVYLYDDGNNLKFNFANTEINTRVNDYDSIPTRSCHFYYEFTRNNINFIIHSAIIHDEYIIQLESSILEKNVAVSFSHADNYNYFAIRDVMKSIGLPELGEKINLITSKLSEIERKRQKEREREEEAKERAKKEFEEKIQQQAEEKRIAEKKKETDELLRKLDEI